MIRTDGRVIRQVNRAGKNMHSAAGFDRSVVLNPGALHIQRAAAAHRDPGAAVCLVSGDHGARFQDNLGAALNIDSAAVLRIHNLVAGNRCLFDGQRAAVHIDSGAVTDRVIILDGRRLFCVLSPGKGHLPVVGNLDARANVGSEILNRSAQHGQRTAVDVNSSGG